MILQLIGALLGLANSIAGWAANRQLISAGEAQIVAKALTQATQEVQRAQNERDRIRNDLERNPDRVRDDDGFKRD